MKRSFVLFWLVLVAFVFFSGKAANAGVFGNDNLVLTEDQQLVFQAAGLNGEMQLRIQLGEIPVPRQALAHVAAPVEVPVAAPVAQAPVNYQPQQAIVDPFAPAVGSAVPVHMAPPVVPPTQMARPPMNPPLQPRQPESRVASVPAPTRPAAPVAAPAPTKSAAPVNREQLAKVQPAPAPAPATATQEERQFHHMKVPIERVPTENRVINGKEYKPGDTLFLVTEEVNGKSDPTRMFFTETPPANSKLEIYKEGGRS